VTVSTIPGPCAAITALTLSALPTGRFSFEGFLSANKSERRAALDDLKDERRTMIFHEAPHKLKTTLADMLTVFGGDRKISLCRELTKLNEQVLRTDLAGAVAYYEANDPRGEFVLVVEGATGEDTKKLFWEDMTIPEHVSHYINNGMSKNDAIKAAAKDRKVPKNEVYKEVLDI
jgi:16S rRNA (cytidine1402-2'-O)-methyltransferase